MGVRAKNAEQRKYEKVHGLCAVNYQPTEVEQKAYEYCVNNDIRISPIAAESGTRPAKWWVGISDPSNYKKIYKSRFQFDNHQIWPEIYKSCLYYYEKIL